MQLASSAENSSLSWRAHFDHIEDIGRGRTPGIIDFCSGTGDMLDLVELHKAKKPGNVLEKYLPALRSSGCASARTSGRRCSTYSALPQGLTRRGG
ncbi:chitosanase [Umezawaea beigongshangensis]|uniref:chitosanase n=1 Tax=Umezawaea beigongshangensis TaxID=2780383 RepID=UPI0018F1EC27|nr:chitosanase [Umezawaea beigongshangensis]